jgi:hypothetical protein
MRNKYTTPLCLALIIVFLHSPGYTAPPGISDQDGHSWSGDATDGFPENSPLSTSGRWEKLVSFGGPPNPVWIWQDEKSSCNISLRKIPPHEGETVEEVAQLYAQSQPEQTVKTRQSQLTQQAILVEQTTPTGRAPNLLLKIFQRGPDIWMLSGSWYGKESCTWCHEKIPNYAQREHQ